MECYKVTDATGNKIFRIGGDKLLTVNAVAAYYDETRLAFGLPENFWCIVWHVVDGEAFPIDMFFLGDDEPDEEIAGWIESDVLTYRDSLD